MNSSRPERSLNLAPASLDDYRALARRRLPRQIFDYIDGGAFAESTMRANSEALHAIRFRQRILHDVSNRSLSTTVLGQEMDMPVILAPVGFGGMSARRAEVQAARAAERHKVPFCESTLSICGIEEVSRAVSSPIWFQLYVMKDRRYAEDLMARATSVSCPVLILTVDLPVVGQRYRDVRNAISGDVSGLRKLRRGADLARHTGWLRDVAYRGRPLTFGNLEKALPEARVPADFQGWVASQFDPSVTWDDLAWLREHWKGRLALKGILDVEDARIALDHGVDAIVVSNHGGRQLDDVPATIAALPAIADAVGDRCEVLMDGGVRSGLDVVKALALGARACLIGRPWAYAVAADGQRGVEHVLRIMKEEIRVTMGLTGTTDLRDVDRSILIES